MHERTPALPPSAGTTNNPTILSLQVLPTSTHTHEHNKQMLIVPANKQA